MLIRKSKTFFHKKPDIALKDFPMPQHFCTFGRKTKLGFIIWAKEKLVAKKY